MPASLEHESKHTVRRNVTVSHDAALCAFLVELSPFYDVYNDDTTERFFTIGTQFIARDSGFNKIFIRGISKIFKGSWDLAR